MAKTPPSPSSSARMMNMKYLMLTTRSERPKNQGHHPQDIWGVGASAGRPVKQTLTA